MKKIIALFSLLILVSCSNDDGNKEVAPIDLLITNISPSSGPKNTPVTIIGSGFSAVSSENAVTINGKVCSIINSTSTQITITIPPSADSGKIKVETGTKSAESNNFEFVVTTTVTTLAGSSEGSQDGQGTNAQFNFPNGITIDSEGNLYVADKGNHRIRKITPTGFVTTIAGFIGGFENGQGILAKFTFPNDLTISNDGTLFVTDTSNQKIRSISNTGFVFTITGNDRGFDNGNQFDAQFDNPEGIIIDATGNLFVVDNNNDRICKITSLFQTPITTTFAGGGSSNGDGQGVASGFFSPRQIAIDSQGNFYVVDSFGKVIRKISPTGLVTTIAGSSTGGFADGQGVAAKFNSANGIVCDARGNLFVADSRNNKIRKISPTGLVSTVAGTTQGFSDGNVTTAQFNNIIDIAIDAQGNLYVTDGSNNKIRKITFD